MSSSDIRRQILSDILDSEMSYIHCLSYLIEVNATNLNHPLHIKHILSKLCNAKQCENHWAYHLHRISIHVYVVWTSSWESLMISLNCLDSTPFFNKCWILPPKIGTMTKRSPTLSSLPFRRLQSLKSTPVLLTNFNWNWKLSIWKWKGMNVCVRFLNNASRGTRISCRIMDWLLNRCRDFHSTRYFWRWVDFMIIIRYKLPMRDVLFYFYKKYRPALFKKKKK